MKKIFTRKRVLQFTVAAFLLILVSCVTTAVWRVLAEIRFRSMSDTRRKQLAKVSVHSSENDLLQYLGQPDGIYRGRSHGTAVVIYEYHMVYGTEDFYIDPRTKQVVERGGNILNE